jgi:hypothetical protein
VYLLPQKVLNISLWVFNISFWVHLLSFRVLNLRQIVFKNWRIVFTESLLDATERFGNVIDVLIEKNKPVVFFRRIILRRFRNLRDEHTALAHYFPEASSSILRFSISIIQYTVERFINVPREIFSQRSPRGCFAPAITAVTLLKVSQQLGFGQERVSSNTFLTFSL